MTTFLQFLVYGVQLGSVYALLALGYSMVYGIVRMINMAHGDFLMIGALSAIFIAMGFSGFMVDGRYPFYIVLAIILSAMILTGLLGVLVEKIAYKPLRDRPRMSSLITAVGVSMFLQNFPRALPFIGPQPRPFPQLFPLIQFRLGGVVVTSTQIILIVVSIILMISLDAIVQKTKFGAQIRAVSFDKDASLLMGIDTNRVISYTFLIGAVLAAASGIFYASIYPQVDVYMGSWLGTKSFIAAVIGGIGSIRGAILGGFILGITEILATSINSNLGYGIGFVILIVILLIKPAGILGKTEIDKV